MNLDVFSDLSEQLNYKINNFNLYIKKGTLIPFDKLTVACHWHLDLEFIVVLKGYMDFFVNGETIHLEEKQGLFVNSKRLHYGFSSDKTDCEYIVVCVHPSLLGNKQWIGQEYWETKFGSTTQDYVLFTDQVRWHKKILNTLLSIYDEFQKPKINPLRLLSIAVSLCADIGDRIEENAEQTNIDQSLLYIWKMTDFIHGNYEHKITLNDIASAGSVSRSQCCILFGKYIGQTPNSYLTKYRIQKSCELLSDTERTISEIALTCGFQDASYFSQVFRKMVGVVPHEYRKINNNK
jgi:AraC-like DNA-binding protein/mannose-6-phosphate isomerase-like protein (cupin superfamily)